MRNDHIHRQVERSGTEVEVKAIVSRLVDVEAYIREEADFNRSWTDGRRHSPGTTDGYIARRLELAAEREAWADAIAEAILRLST